MATQDKEARITINNFIGFPEIHSKGSTLAIQTIPFLDAAKEVVIAIEAFGKIFSPIVYDIKNNIQKISSVYEQDKSRYAILEEILNEEKTQGLTYASNGLLWLKRALELISMFFYNILMDEKQSTSLTEPLRDAYEKTLKKYHRWIVQNTFALVYRWVPTRSDLFGSGQIYSDNIKQLRNYQEKMHLYLKEIDILIATYNFDDQSKV